LSRIPRNAANHDINFAARTGPTAKWDGSKIATCITCGSSTKGHPSAGRRFTARELATLQTYSLNHIFEGNITNVLKQIGNSVPPQFAKQLQRENIRHLRACGVMADRNDHDIESDDRGSEVIVID
jgi:DNA (cytosine-5)-methyltransferase 1